MPFLRQALDLLVPEGHLILTTPNIDGFQARILGPQWRSVIYDHLYLFSIRTLSQMLEAAGARVAKIATWGGWALGLRPAFIKGPLDAMAKRSRMGDVMSLLCVRSVP
jgi:hypothetical protein